MSNGMFSILEVIVKPQVGTVGAAAVNIGSRNDEAAEFRAGIAVVAVKNIGAEFQVQVLSDAPDRPRLQDSGRILHIVDGGKKHLKQRVQLYLDFGAQVMLAENE